MKRYLPSVFERIGIASASGCFFARYGLFMLTANMAWEIAHLPLYTLWTESDIGYLAYVVVHCTAGDLMIAFATLVSALILVGDIRRPGLYFSRVAGVTVALGIAYTIFSEWLNVSVRQSWAYSELMPVIPILGTGISPTAQWIFLPLFGLLWARKSSIKVNY